MRRWVIGVLGIWRGEGGGDRGGRILSQLGGFQVSRKGLKGEERGVSKGKGKSKGSAPCTL